MPHGIAARTARAWLLGLTLGSALLAAAQLPVPPLRGHVDDQTATLTEPQQADLERTLSDFEARKGSQIAVLIVRTTAPEPIEQYALRVAEVWKLGRKKVDDGAILVVANDDHALRIEVGYGLEGALNDATSARIIDEVIVPRFRQQDFAGGIAAGVDRMIRVIDGEPLPAPRAPAPDSGDLGQIVPVVVIVAVVLGAVLRAMIGRMPGALVTGGLVAAATWWWAGAVALALLAGLIALVIAFVGGLGLLRLGGLGRRGGAGRGGFSGGGGGFGGGGASGRW